MNSKLKKFNGNLLSVLLILFISATFAFSAAAGLTYAGRSESPNHILTYTNKQLTWGKTEGILENGSARLSVFDAEYQNVTSGDGKKVIAPGTQGHNIIRLKNSSDAEIKFTAVLYSIKSDERLPVKVNLADGNYKDYASAAIPDGLDESRIIRSVSGSVNKGEISDFYITWLWEYETDEEQDMIDTYLGNKAAVDNPDDIEVGFYIVVEDNNEQYLPKTGEDSKLSFLLGAVLISAILLILTIFGKFREHGKR